MGSTAETSSELMHTVLAVCSKERVDNTRIGAKNNCKKDQWNRESGKIVLEEVSSS